MRDNNKVATFQDAYDSGAPVIIPSDLEEMEVRMSDGKAEGLWVRLIRLLGFGRPKVAPPPPPRSPTYCRIIETDGGYFVATRYRDLAEMAEGFIRDVYGHPSRAKQPTPRLGAAIAMSRLWNDEATHAHSLKVMDRCRPFGETAAIVGVLHDVAEGGAKYLRSSLVDGVFGDDVSSAVLILSPFGVGRRGKHEGLLENLVDWANYSEASRRLAFIAKTMDRLENVQRCIRDGHSLLKAYKREHESLRAVLTSDPELMAIPEYAEAWSFMDKHLGGE